MSIRRRTLLLFIAGLGLTIGGSYAVDHIDAIFTGQPQSAKLLAGLGIGALPVIIGILIMTMVAISVVADLRKNRRSTDLTSPIK